MSLRSSWMVSLADMLSILVCFLVLAYGLKGVPETQRDATLSSIREVFRPGRTMQAAVPALEPETRGGNYWATWLKARVEEIPALAGGQIAAHGATASLTLETSYLTDADVAALADLLRRSGAPVAVRADAPAGQAVAWAEAGERARMLADRLVAAGLQDPRILVGSGEAALAVEIGGTER